MYKLIKNIFNNKIDAAYKEVDGMRISFPFNPDNSDYQEYLAWVAEGNEPEPADE